MKGNRQQVQILNFSISVAILSLVMLILGYKSIIAFAIVAVLGLLLRVENESLTKNVIKVGILYVIDAIFGVVVYVISLVMVKPFEWLGELIFKLNSDVSSVFFNIGNWIRDLWNNVGELENLIILALYVIAAISLIKKDDMLVPGTKKLINKIVSFNKDEE
jgi:hypothetical protein